MGTRSQTNTSRDEWASNQDGRPRDREHMITISYSKKKRVKKVNDSCFKKDISIPLIFDIKKKPMNRIMI